MRVSARWVSPGLYLDEGPTQTIQTKNITYLFEPLWEPESPEAPERVGASLSFAARVLMTVSANCTRLLEPLPRYIESSRSRGRPLYPGRNG